MSSSNFVKISPVATCKQEGLAFAPECPVDRLGVEKLLAGHAPETCLKLIQRSSAKTGGLWSQVPEVLLFFRGVPKEAGGYNRTFDKELVFFDMRKWWITRLNSWTHCRWGPHETQRFPKFNRCANTYFCRIGCRASQDPWAANWIWGTNQQPRLATEMVVQSGIYGRSIGLLGILPTVSSCCPLSQTQHRHT